MTPRKRRRKSKRSQVRHDRRRAKGFHCVWCRPSAPYNERYVPEYYRVAHEHQRDPWMCFACHLEGKGGVWRKGRVKPTLTAETLEQFWREDVSDKPYLGAASAYFRVPAWVIEKVKEKITV